MKPIQFISSKKILFITGFLAIGALMLFYILQVNALTALAYHIASKESAIRQLKNDTKTLESQYAQQVSWQDMEALAQTLQFERAESVSYLEIRPSPVAQNTAR